MKIKHQHWTPDYYSASTTLGDGDRFWTGFPSMLQWVPPLIVNRAGLARWEKGRSWKNRNSGRFGIEYVSAGDALVVQDGRRHIVKPGFVYMQHPAGEHSFTPGPSGFLHKRYVYIEGPALPFMLESLGLTNIDVIAIADPGGFVRLIKESCRILSLPGESWDKTGRLAELALRILMETARSRTEPAIPPEIRRAVAYMNSHLDHNMTLGQIAAKSGLSVYHFSRRFADVVRTSPMKYFLNRRLAYAATMLKQTSLGVKEIALVCGFEDSFYFATQFRREFGRSPREWRKMG